MPWWGWITVGALLLTAEMGLVDAGFYLVFLGVAALVVGLAELGGAGAPVWLQWLLFAALAVASLVLFRKRLYRSIRGRTQDVPENVEDETAIALESIGPGNRGQVEMRGSRWTAHNDGDTAIDEGARVRVLRVDGIAVRVRLDAS
jgi:hypothetical protein